MSGMSEMYGLKPSNVKRMQKEGKNPIIYSSADGEPRINALGRTYKISKLSDPGRKYYKQSNGSWSWNVPKVSVKPGSAEILPENPQTDSQSLTPSQQRSRRRRASRKHRRTYRK